jgi:hypothetical protein
MAKSAQERKKVASAERQRRCRAPRTLAPGAIVA